MRNEQKQRRLKPIMLILMVMLLMAPAGVLPVASSPTIYPTGTTIYKAGKTYDGYTIFTPRDPSKILMIDMEGSIVHSWEHSEYNYTYAEPLPNGNLLAFFFKDASQWAFPSGVAEVDWAGNVVWAQVNVDRYFHHDFERLENGNTLLLSTQVRSAPHISSKDIWDDHIVEVDPEGNVVWDWYTSDHFDAFEFSSVARNLIASAGGDWSHTNTIQRLPANAHDDPAFSEGNILVSQRNTNIIFIIDKVTKAIVWKIGPTDYMTIGQHDAQMIEEGLSGAGNILVFDNGGEAGYPKKHRWYSRLLEIDPVSKTVAWMYNATDSGNLLQTFFSPFISGQQKLPNNNILIDEGYSGRFFEITPEGEIVWEYISPFFWDSPLGFKENNIYRVWRVPYDWAPSAP